MNPNKIKNLAFGARDTLRKEVEARIAAILAEGSPERLDQSDKVKALEDSIAGKGLDAVVESSAYTWFNRLCALRYMDARGYNPVPVVTPRPGSTQPAILADAAQGIFDPDFGFSRLVRDRVSSILAGGTSGVANRTEAAYVELLLAVCDGYAKTMPYLFAEEAASSLLAPAALLSEGSILSRIVEEMDDEECESVEVLGWLYQFYIAERRADINASKKKRAASDIAPATQLFTPKWVVRYLVDNSLGRLWMLNNPTSSLVEHMEYYIAPEGEAEEFLRVYSPEELALCDPACGSGHILVYAFDLLYEIYLEEGYLEEDIPALILQNNLFGMEIDNRAAEIAKFALEMKAREKDPHFFEHDIDANIIVLSSVEFGTGELTGIEQLTQQTKLLDTISHLGECGSLFIPESNSLEFLEDSIHRLKSEDGMFSSKAIEKLNKIHDMFDVLSRRYSCVVTNPPYMGYRRFNEWLFDWTKENYPSSYFDLCAAFIQRGFAFVSKGGFLAEVTMHTWATDKSYRKMRNMVFSTRGIESMMHMGAMVMPIAFETSATVFSTMPISTGTFLKVESSNLNEDRSLGSDTFINLPKWKHAASSFQAIPEEVISYTLPEEACKCITKFSPVSKRVKPRVGIQTGDTPRFVRFWWEPSLDKIQFPATPIRAGANKRWYPYKNGGDYRKWYGNSLSVVNWENDGYEIVDCARLDNRKIMSLPEEFRFKPMVSWGEYGYGDTSFRFSPEGYLFDVIEPAFVDTTGSGKKELYVILGYLNSIVADQYITALMPGRHKNVGKMGQLPLSTGGSDSRAFALVESNVELSRLDWDSREISWDFQVNPIVKWAKYLKATSPNDLTIQECYNSWKDECQNRFDSMKRNEEELNSIFIEAFGLSSILDPHIPDSKISVHRADPEQTIAELLSYAVGCIMGRYSFGFSEPSNEGNAVHSSCFNSDEDAIVPILDDRWFQDDMASQVTEWLKVVFGGSTLETNVDYIESVLGKSLQSYFVKDFYDAHVKMYHKRPIYWMFSSPKGSFKVLVYMHRYTASTVGQILTKYLREYIEKLNATIGSLDQSDRAADQRKADKYRAVVNELTDWERDVIYPLANEHISIDLDDGVKVNYNKFPHALAKVSGLSDWK